VMHRCRDAVSTTVLRDSLKLLGRVFTHAIFHGPGVV
jgi:hypothetical protein